MKVFNSCLYFAKLTIYYELKLKSLIHFYYQHCNTMDSPYNTIVLTYSKIHKILTLNFISICDHQVKIKVNCSTHFL